MTLQGSTTSSWRDHTYIQPSLSGTVFIKLFNGLNIIIAVSGGCEESSRFASVDWAEHWPHPPPDTNVPYFIGTARSRMALAASTPDVVKMEPSTTSFAHPIVDAGSIDLDHSFIHLGEELSSCCSLVVMKVMVDPPDNGDVYFAGERLFLGAAGGSKVNYTSLVSGVDKVCQRYVQAHYRGSIYVPYCSGYPVS
mgnify:CR=1 FL=1